MERGDQPLPIQTSPALTQQSSLDGIRPTQPIYTAEQRARYLRANRPNLGSREPSIRIRRSPSNNELANYNNNRSEGIDAADHANRRRSFSNPEDRMRRPGPQELSLARISTFDPSNLQAVAEEGPRHEQVVPERLAPPQSAGLRDSPSKASLRSWNARSVLGLNRAGNNEGNTPRRGRAGTAPSRQHVEYNPGMVDYLDVLDPEVSTLTTLTNVQNSLFVPDLGRFLNRRPTYTLSSRPTSTPTAPDTALPAKGAERATKEQGMEEAPGRLELERTTSLATITSRMSESRYAVLPHGASLEGWTDAEKEELNDHVRHLLHSKRAAFKRSMKGFWQYVRRPLGFFVTLYATLITLFGLAWVLFLIGWISVGSQQLYVINVIDNVLVALFALIGDGLAPFRAVDTYHMIFIAHYHHLTWRLRRERSLPKLTDHNDLPTVRPGDEVELANNETDLDVEDIAAEDKDDRTHEFSVLNAKQQARLQHHQRKFAKSHTFYKPHETETHHAFPLRLLVAIVVLLDFHSIFQIALGTCTWSINYQVRPFALTTVILCCSLTCNITGGILISIGDRRTRKKDVVERMFRQELTEQAMKKLEKRRRREEERNEELEIPIRPGTEGAAAGQKWHSVDSDVLPDTLVPDARQSGEKESRYRGLQPSVESAVGGDVPDLKSHIPGVGSKGSQGSTLASGGAQRAARAPAAALVAPEVSKPYEGT